MKERESKRYSTRLDCLTLSVVTPVHWWGSWLEHGERTLMLSAPPTRREGGTLKPANEQRKCRESSPVHLHLLHEESLLLAPLACWPLAFGSFFDELFLQSPHHVSEPPVLSPGCGTTSAHLQSPQHLGHVFFLLFDKGQPGGRVLKKTIYWLKIC